MSNNPFDGLMGGAGGPGGPGGLDLGALMQQAQQMQQDLVAAQQRLAETTVDGTVGGGAVTVTVTGAGEMTGVKIAPDALTGTDADALDELADLVVAAYRDARSRADELAEKTLGPLAGGLPGMGGPGGPGEPTPGQLGF